MLLECDEIVEGIDTIQLAGLDDAHEEIADLGAVGRLIEEGRLSMQDGPFQGPFNEIGIQGRPRDLEKPCQGRPKR
jgi:hypothetical protein